MTAVRLAEIAHARSGDKGNHANVGVIAYSRAGYEFLGRYLTEARMAEYLLPLRPRQYVLRLSISDRHQLASYDVVTAGPRFAVAGGGAGVDSLADEQEGLVSLPFAFHHRSTPVASGERS